MKELLLLTALTLFGCSNTKEQTMIETQKCDVGIFTHSVNSPKCHLQNDTITIHSGAKADFFNAPDKSARTANAPLLLKEIDNTKPFTFTTIVKPDFKNTYDAGAVYLFYNEDLWQKFAFEMDERGYTRLVTVRTIGTSDDNNHDSITQEKVYMKISSDTQNIGFYYSLDGELWQLARLYRNEYPEKIYIALSSQSPIGDGIAAQFTGIELTENSIKNFRLGL